MFLISLARARSGVDYQATPARLPCHRPVVARSSLSLLSVTQLHETILNAIVAPVVMG